LFGSLGAPVVVNDLGGSGDREGSDATVADGVVAEIKAADGDAVANPDSVTDGEKIILRDNFFHKMSDEDWDSVISVHLKGTFICCQEFVNSKSQGNGHIINVSAACGIQGRKNGANFCSAKAGILAFTKCLALELSPRIQVNCLIPSAVDTPEVRERYKLDTKEGFDSVVNGIPMGRLGKTEDVTQMVNCILSSSFTTGATFYVNGGEYMS